MAIAGLLGIASLRRWLMAAGAIAAIGSLPLTGHALVAHPVAVAVSALAAHSLAAAFWAGSLAGLFLILRRQPERAAAVLRRFSPLGMAAVLLLLAAGIILAKAVLLVLLVALALLNRYRLLPALERGASRSALRRCVVAELILVACVVALTAALVQTPPPAVAG